MEKRITKLMKWFAIAFISIGVMFVASCATGTDDDNAFFAGGLQGQGETKSVATESKVKKYGTLVLGSEEEAPLGARMIDSGVLETLTKARVTVEGDDIPTPVTKDVTLKNGKLTGATVEGILIGKNRVVSVEAADTASATFEGINGMLIRAVCDITEGTNKASVDWTTTARGNVFHYLIQKDKTAATPIDVQTVTNAVVDSYIKSGVHPLFINAEKIADDIIKSPATSCTQAGQDGYVLTAKSVKFKVKTNADRSKINVYVNDIASKKLTLPAGGTDATEYTISGVAPSTSDRPHKAYLLFDTSIMAEKKIAVPASATAAVDLGVFDLKPPLPRLEEGTGDARTLGTESISKGATSGKKTIYLSSRLKDDDTQLPDVTIYYTKTEKSGSTPAAEPAVPTSASTKYVDATGIEVQDGTRIKAIAISTSLGSSDVSSYTFKQVNIGFMHPDTGDYSVVAGGNTDKARGAVVDADGTSFTLYSATATKVLLEIYDAPYGKDAKYDYWMTKDAKNDWRIKVKGVGAGAIYAYRCWGPNWTFSDNWTRGNSTAGYVTDCDTAGNRFNPNKVCFDPYTREMTHDKSNAAALEAGGGVDGGIYGTGEESITYAGKSGARRIFDTGRVAPKGYVVDDKTSFGVKPNIAQKDAIIYEAHARGVTEHSSSASLATILSGMDTITGNAEFANVVNIPDAKKGTYAGVALLVPYLKAIGVNTIELLPIHESDNDANPADKSGGNYWAYMTYGYFAPDRRYSSDKTAGGPTREFKEMVKAFHDAGMEVYLDVVYNHSGEGGVWHDGPADKGGDGGVTCEITFMRGIDNPTYYELCGEGDAAGHYYYNHTGCGNDLHCDNAVTRQLIIDSLTYWLSDMGVDGFRFDLAPVLGHVQGGKDWHFDSNALTLQQIAKLGRDNNVEMIAEAWDAGGCYKVGEFPSGWGEWNGKYRDSVRGYIGAANRGSVLDYVNGDYNVYHGREGPQESVNFIVAHDGFTLADLGTYGGAGNSLNGTLEWPFGPSDGGNGDNNSVPGPGAEDKRRTHRNYFALQAISRGVQMIVWGDEFGRTQNGNNNPYNVDSVATWNNYNMINTSSPHAVATGGGGAYHNNFGTFGLKQDGTTKVNPTKDYPSSSVNGNFVFSQYLLNLRKNDDIFRQANYSDVTYDFKKEDGTSNLQDGDKCVWIDIHDKKGGRYLVFSNMHTATVQYAVPPAGSGKEWKRLVDTNPYWEVEYNCWTEDKATVIDQPYGVEPNSIVILKLCDHIEPGTCTPPTISVKNDEDKDQASFKTSVVVTLTTDRAGQDIYYVLDDGFTTIFDKTLSDNTKMTSLAPGKTAVSGKTVAGTKYTGPVTVNASKTLRAVCVPKTGADKDSKPVEIYLHKLVDDTNKQARTANKSGVMLQGFNWSSAPRGDSSKWGKWYKIITQNAAAIKDTFTYLWCPPPSKCDTASSEGYAPTELYNLNNCYGTEAELKAMITAIGSGTKKTGAIADIVVNHRAGSTCWGDFQNPSFGVEVERDTNGKVTGGINYSAICIDDEGFVGNKDTAGDTHMKAAIDVAGAKDTGIGYESYRDLDHTNPLVQNGITAWMNTCLRSAGFVGWRYDYVKGYGGTFVGKYNRDTGAEFSVGEYWPSDGQNWIDSIDGWIKDTKDGGYETRAFDFVLKSNMNSLFGYSNQDESDPMAKSTEEGVWNCQKLADGGNLYIKDPSHAVTFVDNHDTGSTQHHWMLWKDGVGPMYALILTQPGYPSVAWQHYFTASESKLSGDASAVDPSQYMGDMIVLGTPKVSIDASGATTQTTAATETGNMTLKEHINYLVKLREAVGIGYDSERVTVSATAENFASRITGTNGELYVIIGYNFLPPTGDGYLGNKAVYGGLNFAIYEKGVNGTFGTAGVRTKDFTITDLPYWWGDTWAVDGEEKDPQTKVYAWNATEGQGGASFFPATYNKSTGVISFTAPENVNMCIACRFAPNETNISFGASGMAKSNDLPIGASGAAQYFYYIQNMESWWGDASAVLNVWLWGDGITDGNAGIWATNVQLDKTYWTLNFVIPTSVRVNKCKIARGQSESDRWNWNESNATDISPVIAYPGKAK